MADLKLTDEQGELQLVADWGTQNPIRVVDQQSPEGVQSVQLTSDQPYLSRVEGPPYPVFLDSFANGQGQLSYDSAKAAYDAYDYAERLDLNTPGLIKLGPRVTFLRYDGSTVNWDGGIGASVTLPTMRGPGFAFGGKQYLTFTGTGSQIRYLVRSTVTVSSSWNADGYEGMAGKVMAVTGLSAGSYLRSRATGYLYLAISALDGSSWRCQMMDGDPNINEGNAVFDVWNLQAVSFDANAPTELVRDFTTDGANMYAACSDDYNNGQVVYGKTSTGWNQWSPVDGMLRVCHSGGVLYGARAISPTVTELGYFGASKAWVSFAITGLLNPAANVVGMCAANLFVYAALTDGSNRSYLMRMRHDIADTYSQVAEFPEGFVATCVYGANGVVYVGGYRETGDLDLEDKALIEGLVYAVVGDSSVVRIAVLNQESNRDMRVLAIGSRGTNLLFVTTQDVFRYNLELGATSHYADITTAAYVEGGTSGEVSFTDSWFYEPELVTMPTDVGFTESGTSAIVEMLDVLNAGVRVQVDAKKYLAWHKDHGSSVNRTFELLVGDPKQSATSGNMKGQCLMAALSNPTKVGAIRVEAKMSGSTRTSYTLQAGKWAAGAWNWTTYQKSNIDKLAMLTLRMTIDDSVFKVYLNEELVFTIPVADLAPVTGSGRYIANRYQWGTGWWWNPTTDTVGENCTHLYAAYLTGAAIPPNYTGTPSSTSYVSDVMLMQGKSLVPVPGKGMNVVEPDLNPAAAGYIRTSATTLREGSSKKTFAHVDVLHGGLLDGQNLRLGLVTENGALPLTEGEVVDEATQRFRLNRVARKVAMQLELSDTQWNRASASRLRVYGLSLNYMPEAKHPTYEFTLSVTKATQGFTQDPSKTIDRLLALVGKTVPSSSLYGDFDAYVEQADYVPVSSSGDYPYKQGRIRLLLRNLSQ